MRLPGRGVLHGPLCACVSACLWGHLQYVGATRGVQTSVALKHLKKLGTSREFTRPDEGLCFWLVEEDPYTTFREASPPQWLSPCVLLVPEFLPLSQGTVHAASPCPPTARASPLSSFSPCGSLSGGDPSSKAVLLSLLPSPSWPSLHPQSACHWPPCFSAFLSPFLQSLVFLRPPRVDRCEWEGV